MNDRNLAVVWQLNPEPIDLRWIYVGAKVVLLCRIEGRTYDVGAEVDAVDGDTIRVLVDVLTAGTPEGERMDEWPAPLDDHHPLSVAMADKPFVLTKAHVFLAD